MLKNETWLLTKLPKGKKVIRSKWVFKMKQKASDDIDRYKARLVAKDFTRKGETILVNHLDDGVHGQGF